MPMVELRAVIDGLAGQAEALCRVLLPGGRREGAEWVEAASDRGGLGDSLKVTLTGAKRGCWYHFAARKGGDALGLVAYVKFGDDMKQAWGWALDFLGLRGPDARAKTRALTAWRAAEPADDAAERDRRDRNAASAFRIWLEARASIAGTPAELYLRRRGLDLRALGRQPGALRFHPALFCKTDGVEFGRLPALVALVDTPDGRHRAVHRTYLTADGHKASVPTPADAKKIYGPAKGGFIALWKGIGAGGARGRKMAELAREQRADAAPAREHADNTVWVSEGIEDGLTAVLADPSLRVIAGLSVSLIGALELPACFTTIGILRQNDAPGSPADLAMQANMDRWLEQGRAVKEAIVAASLRAKDINELINGVA